jgi:hypothetical protein
MLGEKPSITNWFLGYYPAIWVWPQRATPITIGVAFFLFPFCVNPFTDPATFAPPLCCCFVKKLS